MEADNIEDPNAFFGGYKSYQIVLTSADGSRNAIERRYSDFKWLRDRLEIMYYSDLVPKIPGKNMMVNIDKESKEFMETRRRQLESFLNKCCDLPQFYGCQELYEFLTLSKEAFKTYVSKYKPPAESKLLKSTNWDKIYDTVNEKLKLDT